MSKVAQTEQEMQKQFETQLDLLSVLTDAYDGGQAVAAKSIATSVRVLLHDTTKSHSLLGQLGKKTEQFYDSCTVEVISPDIQNIGGFCGLVSVAVGGGHSYVPYLDESPGNTYGNVSFDEYWNRIIFRDKEGNEFSRKNIILAVANQDGGAHVDPKIDEKYRKLTRYNTIGLKISADGAVWDDAEGAELAAVRQIAHEILRTFKKDYPEKQMINHGANVMLGGMGVVIAKTKEVAKLITGDSFQKNSSVERLVGMRNVHAEVESNIKNVV